MNRKWAAVSVASILSLCLAGAFAFNIFDLEFINILWIERGSLVDESTAIVQAAWVQAIGSVLAICTAAAVAVWGELSRRKDRSDDRDSMREVELRRTRIYQHSLLTSLSNLAHTAANLEARLKSQLGLISQPILDAEVQEISNVDAGGFRHHFTLGGFALTSDEESAHRLDDETLRKLQVVWDDCEKYGQMINEMYGLSIEEAKEALRLRGVGFVCLLEKISTSALHARVKVELALERAAGIR